MREAAHRAACSRSADVSDEDRPANRALSNPASMTSVDESGAVIPVIVSATVFRAVVRAATEYRRSRGSGAHVNSFCDESWEHWLSGTNT